jgi:hypothetical protein
MGVRCCGYGAGPLVVGVVLGGMGSGHGLTSITFLCLAAHSSASRLLSSGSRVHTRSLTVVLLASSPGSDIDEEVLGFVRDNDGIEEEGTQGVVPS